MYHAFCGDGFAVFCNVLSLRWLSLDRRAFFDLLSSFNVLIDSLLCNTLRRALLVMMVIDGVNGNKKE